MLFLKKEQKGYLMFLSLIGHLEILKLLRERNWPWDAYTCNMAASRGKLEVLKWARANGCEWNAVVVCSYAASGGHIMV